MQNHLAFRALNIFRKLLLISLTTSGWGFLDAAVQAAPPPYITSGQNNPTNAGSYAESHFSTTNTAVIFTSNGNDGEDYWGLHTGPFPGDSGGGQYHFHIAPADMTNASGWTMTYRAKVINADRNFESYMAVVTPSSHAWFVVLVGGPNASGPNTGMKYYEAGQEGSFPAAATTLPGSSDPSLAYHTYQIIYDPATATASTYIDGTFSASLAEANTLFGNGIPGTPRLEWGDGQGTGPATGSETRWSLVKFELGQHPALAQSFILSRSPGPNAVAVPANTTVDISLQDGAAPVQTNTIQLFFNGSAVSPTISKPAGTNVTTISYDPPGDLPAGSSNTIRLVFNDTSATLVTNIWSFVVFLADQVVIQHLGTNNPTTEGFTLNQAGTPPPVLAGGNDGEDYWRIHQEPLDGDSGASYYRYALGLPYVTNASGWTLSMRVKVNRAIGVAPGKVYVAVVDDSDGWVLALNGGPDITPDNTGVYYLEPAADLVQLSPIDPTGSYRTYQMIYDPSGDSGNGSVTYYADGVVIGTLTRFQTINADVTGPRVEWGDGEGDGGMTDAQYNLIRFQLGQHPISVSNRPTLQISRSGSQQITLSWTAPGFVLQTNSNLTNPTGWGDLSGGASSPTIVNLDSGPLFFRLRQ